MPHPPNLAYHNVCHDALQPRCHCLMCQKLLRSDGGCHLTPAIDCREGRVLQADGKDPEEGLYVVGWAKRGPTGIIGEDNVASTSCLQIIAMALIETQIWA